MSPNRFRSKLAGAALGVAILATLLLAGGASLWHDNGGSADPEQYVSWVRDSKHGLCVQETAGSLRLTFQYTPPEYLALRELEPNDWHEASLRSTVGQFGELEYCTLQISAGDPLSSQLAAEALRLVAGPDTLKCVLLHCESIGLAAQQRYVCAFERDSTGLESRTRDGGLHPPSRRSGSRTLVVDGTQLGVGRIALRVSARAIQRIPTLRFRA